MRKEKMFGNVCGSKISGTGRRDKSCNHHRTPDERLFVNRYGQLEARRVEVVFKTRRQRDQTCHIHMSDLKGQ